MSVIRERRLPLMMAALAALAATLALVACSSEAEPTAAPTATAEATAPVPPTTPPGETDGIEVSAIVRPDSVYSMDDLVAVGYKKSKQFDTETVPHSTEIWYGFFNQRDIEVRAYESHADALDYGVDLAEEAIGREAGQYDYLIPVVNLYPAYMVVGNLVMLCERELAVCEALVARLP